jgi:hypothetical protein
MAKMNLAEEQKAMRLRMQRPQAVAPASPAAPKNPEPPKYEYPVSRVDAANPAPKSELPKVTASKTTVFDLSRRFKHDSNAGEFLDALIGLCAEPPEYLHPQDAVRYLYLLPLLKGFFNSIFTRPDLRGRLVANLTIEELCQWDVLQHWVHTYYGRGAVEAHPLLAHFALDAAQFVMAHAYGRRQILREIGGEYHIYSVEPMVKELKEPMYSLTVTDKNFRREFTMENGWAWARARGVVPEGGRIKSLYVGRPDYAAPGAVFFFRIARCHLSESWNDCHVAAGEETPRAFDLMDEFQFSGEIKGTPSSIETRNVPARWLTHGRKDQQEWVPLPWLEPR